MKRFQDWAIREYSLQQRLTLLAFAGVLFVLILPYLLVVSSAALDQFLHLPRFTAGLINPLVGLVLIVAGGFLALWSIYVQVTIGSGTPVPVMPTRKIVVKGPFVYCRNPMTLGTVIAYLGIAVWIGSFSAVGIVLVLTLLLLIYVKRIEEREIEARFGSEYLEYKLNTPFILPRLRQRG
jgi:protein-S-isoprenylcysteine O-methyltransferase Ste14